MIGRLALLLALSAGSALAQTAAAPPMAQALPRVCDKPVYRQFDFWVGGWDVYVTGTERKVGRSLIEKLYNDCVLRENWDSPRRGFTGGSLNMYDDAAGTWRQTWTDAVGEWTDYRGQLVGGEMRFLARETDRATGAPILRRMILTPSPDGTVRQRVEESPDQGVSWRTSTDLTYRRARPDSR